MGFGGFGLWGFKVYGFGLWSFGVLGFLGLWVLRFWVFEVLGFMREAGQLACPVLPHSSLKFNALVSHAAIRPDPLVQR